MPYCLECGPAEVPHFLTKSNQMIGAVALVVAKPLSPIVKLLNQVFDKKIDSFLYKLLKFIASLKIIRLASSPSIKDTDRTKCMWQAGEDRGVKVEEIWALGKPINVFLAKLPDGRRLVFEGLPRPGGESPSLEWMDNKAIMKRKFRQIGFPVPRGEAFFTLRRAKKAFNEIRKNGGRVVVKPTLGSRSRHTRINIKDEKEFVEAFRIAKQISPFVSVEEYLSGTVHRVVLIGGKVVAVMRRDPPIVVGDGRRTVLELVLAANRDPRRCSGAFHEIPVNRELDMALAFANLNKGSVPAFGQKVVVGTKIGRSQGGTNVDVTDETNLENKKLFVDIGKFLKDSLVGIDFIIEDIGKSWRVQVPCGAIELNSVPFLDLHMYPFEGKPRELSGILWDEVLRS